MSWVTITDNDLELAKKTSQELASNAWKFRVELNIPIPTPREALQMALDKYVGPREVGDTDVEELGVPLAASLSYDEARPGPIIVTLPERR